MSCAEKHGIHRQKDLNKFYSNLLKNNISMGAYNVKASDNTTNEESTETTPRTDQPGDEDVKKEKKLDDIIVVEQKRDNTRRPRVEECHEERSDDGTEVISEEVEEVVEVKDDHKVTEGTSVEQEKTVKKKEKRNTDETVMAARERYLARKRMKLGSSQ